MFLSRQGSLRALEQTRPSAFWNRWLRAPMPSADTIGRVCAGMEVTGLRATVHQQYTQLKRMKALVPPAHGLMVAVVDGHESTASFRRCCSGCLQRIVHTREGDRIQYYHRYVALRLVGRDLSLMLDVEPMQPGEDELACARRLLERVLARYPRAFDVVAGDGLYASTEWFRFVVAHGKDALAVLKENRPKLLDEARTLFAFLPGVDWAAGAVAYRGWDSDTFTSWPDLAPQVRVVRSLETRTVRRQRTAHTEKKTADWYWVTTLSQTRAATAAVVDMGHARWSVENEGFNELVNRWHADHVYKHHPVAMLVFTLVAMLCLNVFVAFYCRNLKPAARRGLSMLHIARRVAAELYAGLERGPARVPT